MQVVCDHAGGLTMRVPPTMPSLRTFGQPSSPVGGMFVPSRCPCLLGLGVGLGVLIMFAWGG
ncbi:hypothetical protein Pmi06nite_81410 [Planotetraspora mira]|uniref:Uncharacterized protein n=1 Tax=Planotetraspora mira TaxID=58121 RepID=A0A8J3XBX8_9ACTN|nr:hypothetical protein Pmi06nite_81410 [Planotetraspora mira]